jgi:hypothetical protein
MRRVRYCRFDRTGELLKEEGYGEALALEKYHEDKTKEV